jgi:hypothetical protein
VTLLIGIDDALRAEIVNRSRILMDFYTAGIAAYSGDRDEWGRAIQRVQAADGDNPYYHWVIGDRK